MFLEGKVEIIFVDTCAQCLLPVLSTGEINPFCLVLSKWYFCSHVTAACGTYARLGFHMVKLTECIYALLYGDITMVPCFGTSESN